MATPTPDQLRARLERLASLAQAFSGTVYRSTTPEYAKESDLLTGEGSKQAGGRWNPPGIAAVYASLTPETAMAETLAHFRYFGISIEEAMPRTFVAIRASLQNVLNFSDGIVRQRLQLSLSRVLNDDWRRRGRNSVSQALGRAAFEAGWEGLLVPSAADSDGVNLVVFPRNLNFGSTFEVSHADRLSD